MVQKKICHCALWLKLVTAAWYNKLLVQKNSGLGAKLSKILESMMCYNASLRAAGAWKISNSRISGEDYLKKQEINRKSGMTLLNLET